MVGDLPMNNYRCVCVLEIHVFMQISYMQIRQCAFFIMKKCTPLVLSFKISFELIGQLDQMLRHILCRFMTTS